MYSKLASDSIAEPSETSDYEQDVQQNINLCSNGRSVLGSANCSTSDELWRTGDFNYYECDL